jgi:hypothetical protein
MKTIREDLHLLAEQAPTVDLGARAVRGARRRRAARLAVVTAAVVCAITGGGAVVFQQVRPSPSVVLTPPKTKVPPLPAKGVGALEQAYQPGCFTIVSCTSAWRIVTRDGDTYELTDGLTRGPLEITPDGRKIAYYSPGKGTIVVRDLASGKVWKAPMKVSMEISNRERALRLSPDGLRFVISGWGGRQATNKLVDVEQGTVTELKKEWWPVSVANGSGPVVLVKPFELTSQVWVLGHKPVTIPDFTYDYSALGADGRTLVRIGTTFDRHRDPMVERDGTIVVFDALSPEVERRVSVTGLGKGLLPAKLGGWVNGEEVTMLTMAAESDRPGPAVYAVNVRTGRSRELFAPRSNDIYLVPGLVH